jgi:hypothetical protein
MSDLEGKTIGISSFGSDTDIAIGSPLTLRRYPTLLSWGKRHSTGGTGL